MKQVIPTVHTSQNVHVLMVTPSWVRMSAPSLERPAKATYRPCTLKGEMLHAWLAQDRNTSSFIMLISICTSTCIYVLVGAHMRKIVCAQLADNKKKTLYPLHAFPNMSGRTQHGGVSSGEALTRLPGRGRSRSSGRTS